MKTKKFGGRARHSVRAVHSVFTDGGQRTARPTNKSVCIRVHPWFNLKPPGTPAHGGERVEDQRIIGKEGNGMTDAGAQPAQTGAREL